MANLKELRNRIASVKATQKITRAMQMVAASKSRRAQEALKAARPYTRRMGALVQQFLNSPPEDSEQPALLTGTGKSDVHLLIVCTSERGLCGGFNSSIVRLAKEHIARLHKEGRTVKLLCVGAKGIDQLRRNYGDLMVDKVLFRNVPKIGEPEAGLVAERVLKLFNEGAFDVATLFYSQFRTVLTQVPSTLQLIPVLPEANPAKPSGGPAAVYSYEPDRAKLLNTLLPRNLTAQILGALLENVASEQGARMSAMDSATRNAGELIEKQTLRYNRTRQALITNELIEIISGAEAL
ncbi:MAG: F0F1 ATP synthase subunit gamma [Methylobacteriaceae bacterium]|jgi:F-type H+-transporting ATPase subunit gamma|nr:F0F1 ATP synthase subunit gamma [Methylobacteriaceae bacterium]